MSGSSGAAGSPCTDSYPYGDGYSCAQQAAWGKCEESWLAGHCDISCGRCGGGPDCADIGPDPCPLGTGLPHACRQRFALGVNFAWRNFAGDFGGVPQWNQQPISQASATYDGDLAAMRAHGASVVRWWMFPDFRGAGILFDANGDPTGISDTTRADIHKALELAAKNDLHLVLTIFSFDNFRPDRQEGGLLIRGIQPIVSSPARRTNLVETVVRQVARTAAQSPHVSHLLGWDLINEPEWAIAPESGVSLSTNFTPLLDVKPVPLADMKALLGEMLPVLASETPSALKSVGWAAAKWNWAFGDVTGVDFHQPHIYAWVNLGWPYTSTPAQLGYGDKPTVIGECYLKEAPFSPLSTPFSSIANTFYSNGYAGMWAWDFYSGNVADPPDASFDLDLVKSFADQKGCQATFAPNPPAPPPPPPRGVARVDVVEPHEEPGERLHWETLERLWVADRQGALAHALEGEARFGPRGRAAEARQAVIVTLLTELGRMPEARQRTLSFLSEHPRSGYRRLVQGLTGIHPRPGAGRRGDRAGRP